MASAANLRSGFTQTKGVYPDMGISERCVGVLFPVKGHGAGASQFSAAWQEYRKLATGSMVEARLARAPGGLPQVFLLRSVGLACQGLVFPRFGFLQQFFWFLGTKGSNFDLCIACPKPKQSPAPETRLVTYHRMSLLNSMAAKGFDAFSL